MKALLLGGALLGSTLFSPAQETGPEVAARVRAGGWFETSRWRRGSDGSLEMHYFADVGDEVPADRFVQLLDGENRMRLAIHNCGLIGLLSLVCHGSGDLLSMTDAGFHFQALGIGAKDEDLRHYLALPAPSFDGPRGRAELLDRLLAIDVLQRRGCKPSRAELTTLAAKDGVPSVLRDRARKALACLGGAETAAVVRKRLDVAALGLPAAFDGCIMIEHARLPDLGWLTALGRRLSALVTAQAILNAGGTMSAAACNGAQRMCDLVSELPFGIAHRFGNARLDHSCIVVTAKADPKLPVSLTWEAAGEFEHDLWQQAELPDGAAENNPLLAGSLLVEKDRLFASTDGKRNKPRPGLAEKLRLASGEGYAVRAIVPPFSKLWPLLAASGLPPAQGGELRVTFGDPAVIVAVIEARDEEEAAAWVEKGMELLAAVKAALEESEEAAALSRQRPEAKLVLDALLATTFSVKGDAAFATIVVEGLTAAKVKAALEALVPRLL